MARRISDTFFHFSGCAFAYLALVEADFTAASGTAYAPPERGNYRRIVAARSIQLLQDTPRYVKTFQLSSAIIRLPSNQIGTDETGNDAGDGRDIWILNSGTGNIDIQNSLGVSQLIIPPNIMVIAHSSTNQTWDIQLKSQNIFFSAVNFVSTNVQDAIIELRNYILAKGRFSITAGFDGNASTGRWLEFITNTASGPSGSGTGFVVPVACNMKELTISVVENSTITVTVYKNFTTAVATVSLAGTRKNVVTVNVPFVGLDEISFQVSAGSSGKILVNGFMYYT